MKTIYDLTNDEIIERAKYISDKYNLGLTEIGIGKDNIGKLHIGFIISNPGNKDAEWIMQWYTVMMVDEYGEDLYTDDECPFHDIFTPFMITMNISDIRKIKSEKENLSKRGEMKWQKV